MILNRNIDLLQIKALNNPYLLASINESRELVCAAS